MEFSPTNAVVKICIQGMALEEQGKIDEASSVFLQAWDQATDDHERFIAAHFVARYQKNIPDKLKWLETALQHAMKVKDHSATAAFPALYSKIAKCYEDLNDLDNAKRNNDLAVSFTDEPSDNGPFFHGTRADLNVGDLLTAGFNSNYKPDLLMNHIYFTASANGAGLAASLAKGEGREHVYIVEPTGSFENDPNVTNKKFPGNPTRSYRTQEPLRIVGEIRDWAKQTPEQLKDWREKLERSKGEIIN